MSRPRCFLELPAGLASVSLRLHGGWWCRPPISRMGNKAGYAEVILGALGLRSGAGAESYLWAEADPDVRGLLRAYPDAAMLLRIAEIIRGWADEEPRALWERLRAERKSRPPTGDDAAAGWIIEGMWSYRQGDIGSGGPVLPGERRQDTSAAAAACKNLANYAQIVASNRLIHVAGDALMNTGNGGTTFGGAEFATPAGDVAGALERLAGWVWEQGHASPDGRLAAQYLNPDGNADGSWKAPPRAWLPHRCDRLASRWPPVAVLRTIPAAADVARWLGTPGDLSGCVVYCDPPYLGTTGYAHDLGRDEVIAIARDYDALGAVVCISEAEPAIEGWHAAEITGGRKGQKRTFSKQQREWLTMNRAPASTVAVQVGLFGAAK